MATKKQRETAEKAAEEKTAQEAEEQAQETRL